jgi:mutator protein MutT
MSVGRLYPDHPIVAVGAVIIDSERVLLIRRANQPSKGEWSLPGGAVEVGESLEAALAREVREETSLDVTVGPVLEVLDRIRRDEVDRVEYHYVIVDYLCHPHGVAAACGSDADEVRWAALDDLASFHLTPTVLAVIEKARTR